MVSPGLQTTVVGSMKKPDYLKIPCWVDTKNSKEELDFIKKFNEVQASFAKDELQQQIKQATQEAINIQIQQGIDIGTDGEMSRDKYIYGFCRTLNGFDFQNPKLTMCRNNSWEGILPLIVSKVSVNKECDQLQPEVEWRAAQDMSKIPIKFTLPGPLTIADTCANEFYKDEEVLSNDLVKCINNAVLRLIKEGCRHIQIDEPVLVRYPEKANKFAIKALRRCFDGVPDNVTKIVHMCCGYPTYLDQTDYHKAEQSAYIQVADEMEKAGFDVISIEDAHRRNAKELLQKFSKTKIMLGVVDVVSSRVETVEEIREHIKDVLQYIPRENLIIAPDCGLIFLPHNIMTEKLSNMVKAAKSI